MANVTINQLPVASTIDAVQDLLPIFTNSSTSTQAISRNTLLGLSSAPVGLTDSQTLTNKILTSPTLNTPTISSPTLSGTLSGTYTIGGTPTFPSSVVTLTGAQTLTNKILTAPTITNATVSADTVTGFTVSSNGTVYGMSVTGGILASAALVNTVNAAALQSSAVLAAKLGLSSSFTGGVTTQANAGTAGGNMYYINLGGLKMLWGVSAANSLNNATSATYTWTLPTSFFTTLQTVFPVLDVPGAATNSACNVGLSAKNTTTVTTQLTNQTGGTNSIVHSVLVIGT